MKLPKVMVHIRLGRRIFEHMQTIQLYKSKTATAIIEDALEKGLAWYLKQAGAELGYTKENPLTWEKLAEAVKLSVITNKDDKPQESQEQAEGVSDYELELELYKMYNDIDGKIYPDFEAWLVNRVNKKEITIDKAEEMLNEHVRNTQRSKEAAKTKI